MSLVVEHLTKVYGRQKAVDNVSFVVNQGEIVGFLGPNGAGKSTTMKICTGYLSPTSGKIAVGGKDVTAHPTVVKRIIGYLPEHNPLYPDLYVHEYLSFVAGLYGLKGKHLRQRVGEMVELCGLNREQNKKIEALSKGYRQRVGLAQALIHDPEVLILDEPTTGLDPNQIVEIRKVIKEISQDKTVIFSTHIMQEVKALCERAIVLNKGAIVADDTVTNLLNRTATNAAVVAEFDGEVTIDDLQCLAGAMHIQQLEPRKFRILSRDKTDIRPEIFRLAADKKLSLIGLRLEENSLENIFRELTIE